MQMFDKVLITPLYDKQKFKPNLFKHFVILKRALAQVYTLNTNNLKKIF